MIISFDIDNTLIPYSSEFEVENKSICARLIGAESIRLGTIDLFNELEGRGHEVWIYTTSFRSPLNLRRTFKAHGLNPTTIINEKINKQKLKKHNCSASKNPKLFGIDIHIDDSRGVEIEGFQYGFATIIIGISDDNWVSVVSDGVRKIELQKL